jgi:hypothetical protein
MDARTRFLLGGIGGLAPIILFLINLDFERYVADASTWTTVGYVVRALLLFALGGFVAYLHEKEETRITLFLVGVSAPSLIAGYLSTSNPSYSPREHSESQSVPVTIRDRSAFTFAFRNAFAEPALPRTSGEVKHFTLPAQNAGSQFVEGLLGVTPRNVWFVIVGSHLSLADAEIQAKNINGKFIGYKANVYAPYQSNPYYAVVIGSHLTQDEAARLRDQAVRDGFPKNSYYKTFPALPPAD